MFAIADRNKLKIKFNSVDELINAYEFNDLQEFLDIYYDCLLYTSDAADERSSVDLGGRRIIKKKKYQNDRFLCKLQK